MAPDINKEIKKIIYDPERKEALLSLNKSMIDEIKAFDKFNKAYIKTIPKQNMNRDLSRPDIEKLFQESFDERKRLQAKLLEGTLKFQKLTSEEEWEAIMDLMETPSAKEKRKLDKSEEKMIRAEQKPLEKIKEVIESNIPNKERQNKVLNTFSNFETRINELLDQSHEMDPSSNETLRKYNVSRSELEAINREQNEIRDKVYKEFIDMHFEMVEVTTEAEWKAITKAVNKIFK